MMSLLFFFLACAPQKPSTTHIGLPESTDTDAGQQDSVPLSADDTAGEEVSPAVEIVSPEDGSTVQNPVTFTVATAGPVALVALDADGYALGEPWRPDQTSSLTYTFTGTGTPRLVTLTGYDAAGAVVATDSITLIATEAPPSVEISSPQDGSTVPNPVTFTVVTAGPVTQVAFDADGWPFGGTWDPAESSTLTHTFTGTGTPRLITLTGYDQDGEVVASDAITLTIQD